MAKFALYHFKLSAFENKEPLLFPINDSSRQYHTMENLFESYLPGRGGSLNVLEPIKEKIGDDVITNFEPHASEVLQNKNHIIAFRVQRNGKKKIETIDWSHRDEPNYPNVRVLIDNREDQQIIAIENKSTFKAEKAFELIKNHFNRILRDHYVRFECYPLMKREGFWKSVDEIKTRFKDFITRVQFNFIGETPNKHSIAFADKLAYFLKTINSSSGGIFMDFKNEDHLERAKDDITHMADLCYRNSAYNLTVKFRDFGSFSYGQDIKAQWGLDDCIIEEFTQMYVQRELVGYGDPAYNNMAKWFDKIKELFAEYIVNGEVIYSNVFENYIIKKQKAKEITQLLHNYIDEFSKPKEVLRPLAAAVEAGCIYKPSLDDFNIEFKKNASSTSYKRYVKANENDLNPYTGDFTYKSMLEEFKKI